MMRRGKIQRIGFGLLLAGIIVLVGSLTALAVSAVSDASQEGRADILVIDGLKAYGTLERPAVYFYHDRHTKALAQDGKSCQACHPDAEDGDLSLMFKRTENTGKDAVMDIYHDNCISCHKEYTAAGKASGPVTCGQCHVDDADPAINRIPIDLDKSLHYRHVKASDKKCELCHHKYNEETKKLYYAKGEEGACVYCHEETTKENRISNRLASHQQCISCHRGKAEAQQDAGPVQCAGCHDPAEQAKIKTLDTVPRLERNQPDVALVKTLRKDQVPSTPPDLMPRVPFDHKAHEQYNDSCLVCHHESLQTCVSCHTLDGHADGDQVKLAQAMHQQQAQMSCVGCHNRQKEQPRCAGCHHSIPDSQTLAADVSCRTCHMADDLPADAEATGRLADAQAKAMAARLLAQRQPVRGTVAVEDIPDKVTIRKLSDQYQAVELPHRKIVLKLAEANEKSNLAAYFHKEPLTLCQGCHHNSPASEKPPKCASCHGRSSEALNITRPGLLAAYHQQCIECHNEMGIEKPAARDCTACHAKRN